LAVRVGGSARRFRRRYKPSTCGQYSGQARLTGIYSSANCSPNRVTGLFVRCWLGWGRDRETVARDGRGRPRSAKSRCACLDGEAVARLTRARMPRTESCRRKFFGIADASRNPALLEPRIDSEHRNVTYRVARVGATTAAAAPTVRCRNACGLLRYYCRAA
jgi:hypothetical protein